MPANHLNPRLAAGVLLALLLVGLLCVPAVSAEVFNEDEYTVWAQASGETSGWVSNQPFNKIWIKDIGNYPNLEGMSLTYPYAVTSNDISDSTTFVAKIDSTIVGTGTISYNKNYNSAGSYLSTVVGVNFDTWNSGTYTGTQVLTLTLDTSNGYSLVTDGYKSQINPTDPKAVGFYYNVISGKQLFAGAGTAYGRYTWSATVDYNDGILYLDRGGYQSYVKVVNNALPDIVYYSQEDIIDVNIDCMMASAITVDIISPKGTLYNRVYYIDGEPTSEDSTNATVTVYVVDSQTGYLLQGTDTRIQMMNASAEWEEVFNQTSFTGSAKIPLEKTTDPDGIPYYWIQSTRAGYQQVPETQIFSVYGDRQVIVEMEPTGAPPVDPENAFVEFYVFDWLHNPINHVAVKIGDEYLYTNRQGWVQYELPKNTTYTYTLTAPDYITTTGSVVVGADPRYRVDVEMQVGTVPTNTPTLAPGETLGATPTPDHRTNEQKGQAVIDMIADNAEGIGALGLLCLLMGLLKLLAKW